jgi:hypothetical protein
MIHFYLASTALFPQRLWSSLFSGTKKHRFGEANIKFMLRIGYHLLKYAFGASQV